MCVLGNRAANKTNRRMTLVCFPRCQMLRAFSGMTSIVIRKPVKSLFLQPPLREIYFVDSVPRCAGSEHFEQLRLAISFEKDPRRNSPFRAERLPRQLERPLK